MTNRRRYVEGTTEALLLICPACSTSRELTAPIDGRALREDGCELRDGAWYGLCESCEAAHTDASNAEYEALVRASVELGKCGHNTGPLAFIDIPKGEGFAREGERWFGFWAVSGCFTDAGFDRFRRSAAAIAENLNRNRGTRLLVNVNATGTQAIVHGSVD